VAEDLDAGLVLRFLTGGDFFTVGAVFGTGLALSAMALFRVTPRPIVIRFPQFIVWLIERAFFTKRRKADF
jgi:hypothetical protein